MSVPNELEKARAEIEQLKERIQDLETDDANYQPDQCAGEVFDAIRLSGLTITPETDAWKIQDTVTCQRFEEALRRGCSDV